MSTARDSLTGPRAKPAALVTERELRELLEENERLHLLLQQKPDQPIQNAARRLILSTDDAERSAALGDLLAAASRARPVPFTQVEVDALELAETQRDRPVRFFEPPS